MKKLFKITPTLAAVALCVASAGSNLAMAQEASTDNPITQQDKATRAVEQRSRCSQLIGTTVQNPQGQKLGSIADVVISFDTDQVAYCVMRVKPGFFARTKLVEVPLGAFQSSSDGSYLILNASKANLVAARGFNPTQWPEPVENVWGAEPTPAPSSDETPSDVNLATETEDITTVWGATPAPPPSPAPPVSAQVLPAAAGAIVNVRDLPRNASQAIDEFNDQVQFGYPLMEH
jgi:sporulation protein YlmC with PRC-barrel domain